jgi:integrase
VESGELANHPKENQNILGALDDEINARKDYVRIECVERKLKFPKLLRFKGRGRVLARIYKGKNTQPYNVYWRERHPETGKPRSNFKNFGGYIEALKFANRKIDEIANGKLSGTLPPKQATDALAALERLQTHFRETGRRFSLVSSVSQFCEADAKAGGRLLGDVVDGFLNTVASIKRKPLKQAVEDFAALDEAKAKAPNGHRPEIGAGYARQKKAMLVKFADMLPGHAVCDLNKSHVDLFFKSLDKLASKRTKALKPTSPKSRNHHRTVLGQFIRWAARNDYLPLNHRLLEAESMTPEKTNGGQTEFYTPKEFRALLEAAEGPMQAIIAIGGLAGLRTAELLRLDWQDVWRVAGHIEVTAGKSKTRQRRLVEVCPALKAWLDPFRQFKTGSLWTGEENTFHEHVVELCERAKVKRKTNALRHSFCTYHFALHANENLTAQQAGNSPGMIHAHYKGLATKKEAQAWFNVRPAAKDNVIQLQSKEAI